MDDQPTSLSPPVLILICIVAAIVTVVIAASLFRLCRHSPNPTDDEIWNPNARNATQDKYMEEVRWRNNAHAWQRAKDDIQYTRGWFKAHIEAQRAKENLHLTHEVSAEEYLTHTGNPYQEVLEGRLAPPSPVHVKGVDEGQDGVDELPSQRFPPRKSRLFRTSSVYSGDLLLPSSHLHMVHSSSSYLNGGELERGSVQQGQQDQQGQQGEA